MSQIDGVKFKVCNIELCREIEGLCKVITNFNNEKVIEEAKFVYRTNRRNTVYYISRIEDTDLYYVVKHLNILYYNPKHYNTKGVIITINEEYEDFLKLERKVENVNYIILENEEIEELRNLVIEVKLSSTINEILERYNRIRAYIDHKSKGIYDLYKRYELRRTLYRIVKDSLAINDAFFAYGTISKELIEKLENERVFHVIKGGFIRYNMENFNKLFYIRIYENYEEICCRESDEIVGYIVDKLIYFYLSHLFYYKNKYKEEFKDIRLY